MKKRFIFAGLALLVCAGYIGWTLIRPLPTIQPATTTPQLVSQTTKSQLVWPGYQSAVAVVDTDIVETHGDQTPRPTASTIKVLTALTVLQAKPLKAGEQGPTITITQADIDSYNSYVARDGSVLPIQLGEQLTQYQMLQALMLPSANNIADTLATWAFGSHAAYTTAATTYLNTLGLKNTHVGSDASGLAADSTSTAQDLVALGQAAMKDPVLSKIVGQSQASGFPVVGTINNVNTLLGTANIVGVKTGNSDEAGGVFIGASRSQVNGKSVTIVSAVIGAPTRGKAMVDSRSLLTSAQTNFPTVMVAKAGTAAGRYILPWGGAATAVTSKDLSTTVWGGSAATAELTRIAVPGDAKAGTVSGNATVTATAYSDKQTVPLKLQESVSQPSLWWRLGHPVN
jgi:D-alanyl-D-alanine carboxypeptidase (penicillin-binding protein 5/6)